MVRHMREFTYQIEDPNGMHARPAGRLATFSKQFDADIRVRAGEKEADGKRLLALMSLGATHGTELAFSICGEDEENAATSLEVYLRAQNASGQAKSADGKGDGSHE